MIKYASRVSVKISDDFRIRDANASAYLGLRGLKGKGDLGNASGGCERLGD